MPKFRACKQCKALTEGDKCPICGSKDLTIHWEGIVVIIDPIRSQVAKYLGIKRTGMYALRVLE